MILVIIHEEGKNDQLFLVTKGQEKITKYNNKGPNSDDITEEDRDNCCSLLTKFNPDKHYYVEDTPDDILINYPDEEKLPDLIKQEYYLPDNEYSKDIEFYPYKVGTTITVDNVIILVRD